MSRLFIATALIALLAPGLVSCDSESTGPQEDVITATLTHDGFDFSAGQIDAQTYANNDGDVIAWQPGVSGGSQPNSLWWRNDLTTSDGSNATVDMGTVELSSVSTVPGQFEAPPDISPLMVGHVYVARCHDGFVKFRVTATDIDNWTADVEYVYTTGTTF